MAEFHPLDPHTDQRIKVLEEWKPTVERRLWDVDSKIDNNTKITKETGGKVGEMYDWFTAAKVNAKISAWLAIMITALTGVVVLIVNKIH